MFFSTGVVIVLSLHLTSGTGTSRQTGIGEIVGDEYTLEDGTNIYRFLGIPYSYAPTETSRFTDPQLIDQPFTHPWEATFNYHCLQVLSDQSIIGEEDCLYLNVYTPSPDDKSSYDVLVLIHGGEFRYGYSDDQNPNYLFETIKNVVFVSINYRLGPLGFLSTEDDVVPGNMGLKDQVVALQWVQTHIRHFGGNPDKVTLAGVGAGAVSVHLHYLSPLSKDLFAQGISISGGALSPLVKTKNVRQETQNLAEAMKCPTDNSAKMIECLRNADAKDLLEHTKTLPQYQSFYPRFGPVIEKEGSASFLATHPFSLLQNGQVKNAPWLVSTLKAENYLPPELFTDMLQDLNSKWNDIVPKLLRFSDLAPEDKIVQISEQVRQKYFKNQPITRENVHMLSKLIADRLYLLNIENAIRLHATASTAPVYLYTYDYVGSSSVSKTPTEVDKNAMDDYVNILKVAEADNKEHNEDKDMIKTMVQVWQSFIENGVPGTTGGIDWPVIQRDRIEGGDLSYVNIAGPSNMKVISSPGLSDRYFWNTLPLDEPRVSGLRRAKEVKRGLVSKYIIGPVESVMSIFLKALRFIFISPLEVLFSMSSGGSSKL